MEYKYLITKRPSVPAGGKCWSMVVYKAGAVIQDEPHLYEGIYTTYIGAERAAKRQLRRLNKDGEKDVIQT